MCDVVEVLIRDDDQLSFDAFPLKERSGARGNFNATKCLSCGLPEHHRNHRPWMQGVIWHPGVPEAHIPQDNGPGFDSWLYGRMACSEAFEVVWFDDAFDIATVCGVQMGCWPELRCAIGCAHINNGDVYDDCGGWRVVTACDGVWHIWVDRLRMVTWERGIARIEAVFERTA